MIKRLLFLLALLPSILFAQNTIKGTFTPADQFKFAFLYRVTAETSVFVNNADVKDDGAFEIKLDSTAIPGTYRIVYAQPQDQFNFDVLYNGKEDIELTFDLETGIDFKASNENKLLASYNKSMNLVGMSINNYYSKKEKDEAGYKDVFKILSDTQKEFEKATKGMLANEFIKASSPYIPSKYETPSTFSKNVKDNYFTPIDYSNTTLQNSNFLIEATLNYVFGFVDYSDENKSFKGNIDAVAKAVGDNPKIKKILFEILWNQFSEEENEPIANYLATEHLIALAKSTDDKELTDKLITFKNVSIGNIAPDFKVEVPTKDNKVDIKNLSELENSDYYLLLFWSTTCSHCLDELPKLKDFVKGIDKERLTVIAVALDDNIYRWKDMTYDYPDFLHIFGEGKWDNPIGNIYNVSSTPSYFLLNKDKKIIGKPYDFPAFEAGFNKLPAKKEAKKTVEVKE